MAERGGILFLLIPRSKISSTILNYVIPRTGHFHRQGLKIVDAPRALHCPRLRILFFPSAYSIKLRTVTGLKTLTEVENTN